MVRRGEILDDSMEDEFYLRRLDAGLFVLQLICYIMVEISNSGNSQVRKHTYTDSGLQSLSDWDTWQKGVGWFAAARWFNYFHF